MRCQKRCIVKNLSRFRGVKDYLGEIRGLREEKIRKNASRRQPLSYTLEKEFGHAEMVTNDR